MNKRLLFGSLALTVAALALVAAGCGGKSKKAGGGGGGGNAKALSAATCTPIKFGGSGSPDYLIASDLPLQGSNRPLTTEMVKAIGFILQQHNYKAGKWSIGYQSCDDSTAQAGGWDSARCSSNARGYASNQSVIGVVGTFNSGCAKLEIPVLNRASNGPVGIISPANTYPGLTIGGPGTESGEPDVYYPTGKRNYARVVWTDQFQGAADGLLIKSLGLKNVFILTDKQTYGLGIAKLTERALKKLGIGVAGPIQAWDAKATSYEAIASKIKSTGADGVFLGGIVCNNGGKLLKDLRAGLGPDVTFIGPDGWTPISATIQEGGAASDGMYVTQPGIPTEQLKGAGKKFSDTFGGELGHPPDPYTAYAAQAAEVLIDAISRSDGTRADVAAKLHNVTVNNGILGNFKIDASGDTTLGTVSVNRIKGKAYPLLKTITPKLSFVKGT